MPVQYVGRKLKRFFVYRVLHVDDTPHRIALGLAIGIFITWTPTMGFQMLLTVLLASLVRANKFVGVPFVWISNPVTAVPLYGFNFIVGTWVLPGEHSFERFYASVSKAAFAGGGWLNKVAAWWEATIDFFWPLWVGSIVVAVVLAVPTYITTRWAIVRYRKIWHDRHPEAAEATSPGTPTDPPDESANGDADG